MATKTNTIEKNGRTKVPTLPSVFSRAIKANSEWPEKDEFLDVIYWSRQLLGIILGVIFGIIPMKGFVGLALFIGINCGVVYLYSINFQSIDEESYGGIFELLKEGFMNMFACFLVTWIIFYTGIHFDQLQIN